MYDEEEWILEVYIDIILKKIFKINIWWIFHCGADFKLILCVRLCNHVFGGAFREKTEKD